MFTTGYNVYTMASYTQRGHQSGVKRSHDIKKFVETLMLLNQYINILFHIKLTRNMGQTSSLVC